MAVRMNGTESILICKLQSLLYLRSKARFAGFDVHGTFCLGGVTDFSGIDNDQMPVKEKAL
jgi:hypothetical protein